MRGSAAASIDGLESPDHQPGWLRRPEAGAHKSLFRYSGTGKMGTGHVPNGGGVGPSRMATGERRPAYAQDQHVESG